MASHGKQRPDYGIDAPGIVCTMFGIGIALAAVALGAELLGSRASRWPIVVVWTTLSSAASFFAMGCYLIYWSKVAKIRGREILLNLIPWNGDERVLDVGCGRGLMLIAAARRVPAGRAIGIDIWQVKDQTGNCARATLANARIEGVAERIDIQTADMRQLPFADASFDVVVSHWAMHNIASHEQRMQALAEMNRVLKPGGCLLLADIQFRNEYASRFAELGMEEIRHIVNAPRDIILRVMSGGQFQPAATIAQKPLGIALGAPPAANARGTVSNSPSGEPAIGPVA